MIVRTAGSNVASPCPPRATETFFLRGPRQTGKSTLLRTTDGEGFEVDFALGDRQLAIEA